MVLDENIDAGTLQVLNYAGSIKRRTSDMVEVDVVLSKPEDERTLDLLANKIYMDNQGSR